MAVMMNQIQLVLEWAQRKGIFKNGTVPGQYKKFIEEAGELGESLLLDDRDQFVLECGDVLVTLALLAEMKETNLAHCLEQAYNKINKRTGKMVGGVFVKDE